jgi:hypothetical protein
LVLALGVVNLVLATVALSFGLAETTSPPTTAGGPTPGTAVVSPAPTTPVAGGQTPTAPGPAASPTPAEPGTSGEPSTEPSPIPSLEPSPVASPESTIEPETTPLPARIPTVVVARPDVPAAAPSAKPTPRPSPATTDGSGPPRTCHASARGIEASNGKACRAKDGAHPGRPDKPRGSHHDNGRHNGPKAHHGTDHRSRQPATVEEPRRGPMSRYRLRTSRRAR